MNWCLGTFRIMSHGGELGGVPLLAVRRLACTLGDNARILALMAGRLVAGLAA